MKDSKEKRIEELRVLSNEIQKEKEGLSQKQYDYYSEIRELEKQIFEEDNRKYIGKYFRWGGDSMSGVLSKTFLYKILGPVHKDEPQECLAVFEDGIRVIKIRCFGPVTLRLAMTKQDENNTILKNSIEITKEGFEKAFQERMEYLRNMMGTTND